MCGICGFTGNKNTQILKAMNNALFHRGPDDAGYFEDEQLSLGHRRLSIIDLSQQGRQPMANEDSTVWMVINGEIYNFHALRKELITLGHIFISQSDSETAVHAYEEYGEDFLNKLDGMFALAIWDKKISKLILARDRIGIKPLYYSYDGSKLRFASEIKALLEDPGCKRELNQEGFFQYLAFQSIITGDTMFKGIHKLEPASMLIYKNNRINKRQYWSLEQPPGKEVSEDELKDALREAVRSHLVSDVPIGVLLSGGLDSSTIVALMHQSNVKEIDTFTVGFNQPDDEFAPAKEVSQKFKTRHHEIIIQPEDLRGLLKNIVWHMDEPLADGGAIATYLSAYRLREYVKVVLVGEGGDESLAGYNWHKLSCFPFRLLPQTLKKQLYFYFTTFYKCRFEHPREVFLRLFTGRRSFLDAMRSFEISHILPNSLLMKVDKMTMAHSIEARVPFLDYRFLRAASGLAASKKISLFSTKIFLRRSMRKILPENILKRRKKGFIVPLGRWLDNQLSGFARDTLCSSGTYTASILGRKEIEGLFRKEKGLKATENKSLLWRLLIFEIWYKHYLNRS